ncbi:MAG: hypothetical protein B5M54_04750 [Candidatus Aminicenantes bacterium 4484_214]|nr:MAG: hypothetical protein B5M54_04750 [Candidatus Aminicenantes bacterium 4484_214]RLE07652.1 MAG: hypothetical protein DRJ06_05600 [Candidatus Aminicenantes bacterium]HDJ23703.1 hypothetical protein [Candidatus Aminicenantes bacterium]
MSEEFKALTIHQKLEITIQEMIDRQIALHEALAEVELIFLQLAEKKYKGKKVKMAEALGIHRNTLHHLLKKHRFHR